MAFTFLSEIPESWRWRWGR